MRDRAPRARLIFPRSTEEGRPVALHGGAVAGAPRLLFRAGGETAPRREPGPGGAAAGAAPVLEVLPVASEGASTDPPADASEATGAEAPPEADPPRPPGIDVGALAMALREAQGRAEEARARYVHALAEVERTQELDLRQLEGELFDLSIEIARELLLREITRDRLYVVRLCEAALRVVVEDEPATVLVAPADLAILEQERPRLEVARGGALIRVTADPAMHPGDCVVQVGRARIDARLSDRLERVRQALHGVDTETE